MANFNRRSFLKGFTAVSAAAAGGCCLSKCSAPAVHRRKPGEKLNVGVIGVGGKGHTDWSKIFEHGENIVAFCDVDDSVMEAELASLQKMGGDPSKVKRYRDYRKMLASLARLASLEGDYRVLPGHDRETTMDYERRVNPYMRQGTAR